MNDAAAIDLLQGLVRIPSLSRQEGEASAWLAAQMAAAGYVRAYVDEAGNAVGELGPENAARVIMLLGHIDTVPGAIPVRIEESPDGPLLYGRGSVDAKGPLATFAAAGARLGHGWALAHGVRVVVVGAVEEEAASSKGARHIRERFDGLREPTPAACVIGEPSGWARVTLGYKGRLLVEVDMAQPMAHTAGPGASAAEGVVHFWNRLATYAAAWNVGRDRVFDQLQPSLRQLRTWTDEALWEHAEAVVGLRLPPVCDVDALAGALATWAGEAAGTATPALSVAPEEERVVRLEGARRVLLRLHAHEPAWRSERTTPIGRAFFSAIRSADDAVKPAFVLKTGTSDMNVVGPRWNCPIVAYGPGDSGQDHTPHEHLPLHEYLRAVEVVAGALRDFTSFSAQDTQ